MPLSSVVTMVAERLTSAGIDNLPPVDAIAPATTTEVPRITVSVADAVPAARGLGEVPGPPQTGALRIATAVDLADPVLRISGETVDLLSGDRRTLQLPHGAVVRADGTDTPPFTTTDLTVVRGATTLTPTHDAPVAGQVRLDITSGALTFPSPLPATGTVQLGYFVGLWEITAERFAATMFVDVAHDDRDVHTPLLEAVEAALALEAWPAAAGMRSIQPVALSAVSAIPGLPVASRTRRLTYRVEVERIEPVVRTSGGPIVTVDVPVALHLLPDGPLEHPAERFTVEREPAP
jgi:hypothetical protein